MRTVFSTNVYLLPNICIHTYIFPYLQTWTPWHHNNFYVFASWIYEESTYSFQFYRALIRMLAHGLDQLVDLLVVFQGVPQGVLGAEQPLAEAVHLRVQGRGVQHGVPPVVRRRSFPTLKSTWGRKMMPWIKTHTIKYKDIKSAFWYVDLSGVISDYKLI